MKSILLVDDSPLDRMRVQGLLRANPTWEVRCAADGAEALELLEGHEFDLALTDLVMPGMDGMELLAEIRSRRPSLPVVILSAEGGVAAAVRALHAGAATFIAKDDLARTLVESIRSLFEISRQHAAEDRLRGALREVKYRFEVENDIRLVGPLVHRVLEDVERFSSLDEHGRMRIAIALDEALLNAVIHGNLEISSEQRDGDYDRYQTLLDARRTIDPYAARRVDFRAAISAERIEFVIEDEGPGFDPASVPDPTDDDRLEVPGGRGLLLMRTFMDEVEYAGRGNRVRMTKRLTDAAQFAEA